MNQTDAGAGFHLWHIDEPATFADLASHVEREIERAEAGEPGLGHPGFVSRLIDSTLLPAGETKLVYGATTQGTYGIVCARHFQSAGEIRPSAILGPIVVNAPTRSDLDVVQAWVDAPNQGDDEGATALFAEGATAAFAGHVPTHELIAFHRRLDCSATIVS